MARRTKKAARRGGRKKASRRGRSASKMTLVVGSKVKEYIKSQGCKNSSEVLEAANQSLMTALDSACQRAAANKRSTVRAQDF